MIHGEKPIALGSLGIWRDGIKVDHAMQRMRVRNGCFCDGEAPNEKGKIEPYHMCPDGPNWECEIFQDQEKLQMDLMELACMGAKNPVDDEDFEMADIPEVDMTDSDLCEVEVYTADMGFEQDIIVGREVNQYGEWQ